jgi:hypothetical protein
VPCVGIFDAHSIPGIAQYAFSGTELTKHTRSTVRPGSGCRRALHRNQNRIFPITDHVVWS